ncbi:MAG: hypothetical protein QXZ09_01180 [Candidatus Methanomethylicaceae archaeon]
MTIWDGWVAVQACAGRLMGGCARGIQRFTAAWDIAAELRAEPKGI